MVLITFLCKVIHLGLLIGMDYFTKINITKVNGLEVLN